MHENLTINVLFLLWTCKPWNKNKSYAVFFRVFLERPSYCTSRDSLGHSIHDCQNTKHHYGRYKSCKQPVQYFGDLNFIFKVTPVLNYQILTKESSSAPYLLNQMTNYGQTSYIVTLGWFKGLIRFWWPWPNFQGHHTIKTCQNELCLHYISWTNWWMMTKLA